FGTDGIRGVAGQYPLDRPTIERIGYSLAIELTRGLGRAPRLVIGRDTRESGEWIETALARGSPGGPRHPRLRRRARHAGGRLSDARARRGRGSGHFGLAQFIRGQRNKSLLRIGAETRRRGGTGD